MSELYSLIQKGTFSYQCSRYLELILGNLLHTTLVSMGLAYLIDTYSILMQLSVTLLRHCTVRCHGFEGMPDKNNDIQNC